jgi:hypothetical protein
MVVFIAYEQIRHSTGRLILRGSSHPILFSKSHFNSFRQIFETLLGSGETDLIPDSIVLTE